ncbi:Dol-P-Man:Man(5)GlcNAc(2)-PP-Dol alpha-1,3-mannosyltransferase [Mycena kentingensis (nom. inval.)]|nr:Dol-P-Man:Man(5)GlcNAc(2)-PP-Dol alpha-1,3-mannosyltransferase [Mycena kentingensis (nom. inval.)]
MNLAEIQRLPRLLLFDKKYFWWLASLVILGDLLLTQLIIRYVAYTEIDWETYMAQVDVFLKGERDYSRITGPTGPLVYPAGHLLIHRFLHSITDAGENMFLAQQIYGALYILTLALSCAIYRLADGIPNWAILLLPLSKRLHSIFVLRLFNDCWAVLFVQAATIAYQTNYDDIGTLLFSFALSVKMSVLLYLPALLVVLFKRLGPYGTVRHMLTLGASQALFALPFLEEDHWAYLNSAFEFSRVFLYKWTVNWRMLDEEVFLSKPWANVLLIGHVSALVAFGLFKWCSSDGGVWVVLREGFWSPEKPAGRHPVSADCEDFQCFYHTLLMDKPVIATTFFTSNLIGILFARSLHYQFYSWYAQQLPFILWRTKFPVAVKIPILVTIEYAWNVYPSTKLSSSLLLVANAALVGGVFSGYPSGRR